MLDPIVLAQRLDTEIAVVRRQHGDSAFVESLKATAQHEAGHGVGITAEGGTPTKLAIFDKPVAVADAGLGLPGVWHGQYWAHGRFVVDGNSDPMRDLAAARIVISGRAAGLLRPFGRLGSALDEKVHAKAITEIAAHKLGYGITADEVWQRAVWRPTLVLCRINAGVIDRLARLLLRDGVVEGERLQKILERVRVVS